MLIMVWPSGVPLLLIFFPRVSHTMSFSQRRSQTALQGLSFQVFSNEIVSILMGINCSPNLHWAPTQSSWVNWDRLGSLRLESWIKWGHNHTKYVLKWQPVMREGVRAHTHTRIPVTCPLWLLSKIHIPLTGLSLPSAFYLLRLVISVFLPTSIMAPPLLPESATSSVKSASPTPPPECKS